jgi:hypothetical protein
MEEADQDLSFSVRHREEPQATRRSSWCRNWIAARLRRSQ